MDKEIKPRVGHILLEDVTVKNKGTQKFGETRHSQPQLAKIVSFSKPTSQEREFIPWDDQIEVGVVVLKPVTQKFEFDTGDGRKLIVCHHSDLKVFFSSKKDGNLDAGLVKAIEDGHLR